MDKKSVLLQIVNEYPDAVDNYTKMRELLFDYVPEDKRTRNLLLMTVDESIPSQLRARCPVDKITFQRLVNNLVHDYGISSDLAEEAVSAWITALNISISYSNSADITNSNTADQGGLQVDGASAEELFELGKSYFDGVNVELDFCEALKLFRLAANQGYAKAEYMIGEYYQYGWGGNTDISEALKWYRLATEHGDSKAPLTLGRYYSICGEAEESVKWLQIAAVRGNAEAQCSLASDYESGRGTDMDSQKAFTLYRLAAKSGNADAQNVMGEKYLHGDGVQRSFKFAIRWFRKAAAQGHFMAQFNLGLAYENRKDASIDDLEEALKWYQIAHENSPGVTNVQKSILRVQEKINVAWKKLFGES